MQLEYFGAFIQMISTFVEHLATNPTFYHVHCVVCILECHLVSQTVFPQPATLEADLVKIPFLFLAYHFRLERCSSAVRTLFFALYDTVVTELLVADLALRWPDNDIQTHRAFKVGMHTLKSVLFTDYFTDVCDERALILIEDSFVNYQGYLVLHNL